MDNATAGAEPPTPDAMISEAAAVEDARRRRPLTGTDDGLTDAEFFTALGPGPVRPDTEFRFEGPVSRYTLTWRQEAFCRHYAACGNGARAARLAGYSPQSARHIAYENLQNLKVRWRIDALAAARARRQEGEARYLLHMLTGALEMAARQHKPATMVRAVAHLARLSGADEAAAARARTSRQAWTAAGDPEAEALLCHDGDLLPPLPDGLLAGAIAAVDDAFHGAAEDEADDVAEPDRDGETADAVAAGARPPAPAGNPDTDVNTGDDRSRPDRATTRHPRDGGGPERGPLDVRLRGYDEGGKSRGRGQQGDVDTCARTAAPPGSPTFPDKTRQSGKTPTSGGPSGGAPGGAVDEIDPPGARWIGRGRRGG